jgi:hypothetical protein
MVMGVFMAALVTGMIYYVMGIGEAALYREQMQDASDSGAFAAAVMHARGMNILALINIVIAAVLAVLVALKTALHILQVALGIAIFICNVGCNPPAVTWGCWACPLISPLSDGVSNVSSQLDTVEPVINGIMDVSHSTAVAIRTGVPAAAQAKVAQLGSETFNEPTNAGFMMPQNGQLPGKLPVEDDPTGLLCDKASEQAERFVPSAIVGGVLGGGYPVPPVMPSWLGSVAGLTDQFCSDDDEAQRVVPEADLGDEHFQLRTFMRGEPGYGWTTEGVGVASWGRTSEVEGIYQELQKLSKFSMAQAEFYYNEAGVPREEWLWHMKWTARLRKFRMPDSGVSSPSALCSAAGVSGCDGLAVLGNGISNALPPVGGGSDELPEWDAPDVPDDPRRSCDAGQECDDGDPCTIDQCINDECVYELADSDEDGYAPTALGSCGRDCNDSDPTVNPDHSSYEAQPRSPGVTESAPNYDWNCSGGEEKRWTRTIGNGHCGPDDGFCQGEGWLSSTPPDCGETGTWGECHGCTTQPIEQRQQRCR